MTKRASVFDTADPDISDLIGHRKRQPVDAGEIKAIAHEKGFPSLATETPSKSPVSHAQTSSADNSSEAPRRRQVQRETRSKPISIRATPNYFNRFVACLDALGPEFSQADGFEKAIEALEEKLNLRGGE